MTRPRDGFQRELLAMCLLRDAIENVRRRPPDHATGFIYGGSDVPVGNSYPRHPEFGRPNRNSTKDNSGLDRALGRSVICGGS